jgi:hypothetical protein
MLSLVNTSATPLPPPSYLRASTPAVTALVPVRVTQEACLGIPSCSPLVQHELLKAMRQHLPQTYLRAGSELGLTLERTQALLEHHPPIVSAARALKLARLLAPEPTAGAAFAAAGTALYTALQPELNRVFRFAVRQLPRGWRVRLTLAAASKLVPHFAGSTNQIIIIEPDEQSLYLTVRDGLFTDHLATLSGAYFYYHSIFKGLLRDFACVNGQVAAVRRPRLHLHQCNFRIIWKG